MNHKFIQHDFFPREREAECQQAQSPSTFSFRISLGKGHKDNSFQLSPPLLPPATETSRQDERSPCLDCRLALDGARKVRIHFSPKLLNFSHPCLIENITYPITACGKRGARSRRIWTQDKNYFMGLLFSSIADGRFHVIQLTPGQTCSEEHKALLSHWVSPGPLMSPVYPQVITVSPPSENFLGNIWTFNRVQLAVISPAASEEFPSFTYIVVSSWDSDFPHCLSTVWRLWFWGKLWIYVIPHFSGNDCFLQDTTPAQAQKPTQFFPVRCSLWNSKVTCHSKYKTKSKTVLILVDARVAKASR